MKKITKISLLLSLCLIIIGIAISFIGFALNNFRLDPPDKLKFKKVSTEITDNFNKIDIKDIDNSVKLLPAEDENCCVICYDNEKISHDITVKNDTLFIALNDNREWYEKIIFNITNNKLIVYIPKKYYEQINISTINGNINSDESLNFNNISAETINGKINLDSQLNGKITLKTINGNIKAPYINSAEIITLKSINGNINISGETANELSAESINGNITANINVRELAKIETVNGNINIENLNAVKLDTHTVNGKVRNGN